MKNIHLLGLMLFLGFINQHIFAQSCTEEIHYEGSTVVLDVPFNLGHSYQWFRNGNLLTADTFNVLTLNNTTLNENAAIAAM